MEKSTDNHDEIINWLALRAVLEFISLEFLIPRQGSSRGDYTNQIQQLLSEGKEIWTQDLCQSMIKVTNSAERILLPISEVSCGREKFHLQIFCSPRCPLILSRHPHLGISPTYQGGTHMGPLFGQKGELPHWPLNSRAPPTLNME